VKPVRSRPGWQTHQKKKAIGQGAAQQAGVGHSGPSRCAPAGQNGARRDRERGHRPSSQQRGKLRSSMCQPGDGHADRLWAMAKAGRARCPPPWPAAAQAVQSSPLAQASRQGWRGLPNRGGLQQRAGRAEARRSARAPPAAPPQPTGIDPPSPNKLARHAPTSRGWESMRTEPASAGVCPTPGSAAPLEQAAVESEAQGSSQSRLPGPARQGSAHHQPAAETRQPGGQAGAAGHAEWPAAGQQWLHRRPSPYPKRKGQSISSQREAGSIGAANHLLRIAATTATAANCPGPGAASLVKAWRASRSRGDRRGYAPVRRSPHGCPGTKSPCGKRQCEEGPVGPGDITPGPCSRQYRASESARAATAGSIRSRPAPGERPVFGRLAAFADKGVLLSSLVVPASAISPLTRCLALLPLRSLSEGDNLVGPDASPGVISIHATRLFLIGPGVLHGARTTSLRQDVAERNRISFGNRKSGLVQHERRFPSARVSRRPRTDGARQTPPGCPPTARVIPRFL